jgi:N-acyl-D-aspartate/D-glutamate deacylase
MFDVILRGGRVMDGTGNPWSRGDVAVKDGWIAEVGRVIGDAETVIRLKGEVVASGFIDTHSLSTYKDSRRHPRGITHVMVNGVLTVEDGEHMGQGPGGFTATLDEPCTRFSRDRRPSC